MWGSVTLADYAEKEENAANYHSNVTSCHMTSNTPLLSLTQYKYNSVYRYVSTLLLVPHARPTAMWIVSISHIAMYTT